MGFFSKFGKTKQAQPKPEITVTVTTTESPTVDRNKREFSDNDPTLMEDIQSTETYQPTQKLPLSNTCPYCGVMFDKPIGRKKKCPECKNDIFVRTTQDLFPSSALTKDQVTHVDFYMVLKNILRVTKDDYTEHEVALQKRWNTPKVNTYDVLWSMLNDMKLLQRSVDKTLTQPWSTIEMFRNHQSVTIGAARYQGARGNDPMPYLKNAQDYSLKIAKLQDRIKGLTVQAYYCCDACTKFHDKTFSLDFIEKNPVLPIKTCTHPLEENPKFVFCTCNYREYYEYQ